MGLLKRYVLWTYERGSFHYDVMVTLILAFIFLTPRFIDFKDRPAPDVLMRTSELLVRPAGSDHGRARFVYEVRIEALHGANDDASRRAAMIDVIQPIAGAPVILLGYQPVQDTQGHTVAYAATVLR
jgi:hypothetical protein